MPYSRFLFILLCSLLLVSNSLAQSRYGRYGDYKVLPPGYNTFAVVHVDFDTALHVGNNVGKDQIIGYEQERPLVRSVRFGMKLIASEDAYEAGQYAAAAKVLAEAARAEPDNPFITYQLARALYRLEDREHAYPLYVKLVKQLDNAIPAPDSVLAVDAWFVEAYWKLATLYLDREEWPGAIRSIAQFMAAANPQDYENTLLHEQMLGYLTESFYHLHDYKMCRFYYAETLRRFPKNQYVKQYQALGNAKQPVKAPARATSAKR
jgi:tetratricopeptide (TPR) repeat protein